jgi:hypothetical protein
MIVFDRTLLDPNCEDLDNTLRAALSAVNPLGIRIVTIDWPLQGRDELDNPAIPQGDWTWSTLPDPPRGPRPDRAKTVHAVWWSDFAGRRHIRVLGLYQDNHRGVTDVREWPDSFPLLQIYPDAGFELRRAATFDAILVVCPCGAVGRPEEIGWMGTECGPCHDRRAAGVLPARSWERPASEHVSHRRRVGLAFHPTEPVLALRSENGSQLWNLVTSEATPNRSLDGEGGLTWTPDGARMLLANRESTIRVLRGETLTWESDLVDAPPADELHFSPSGRWLVGLHYHHVAGSALWVRDCQRGTATPLTPQAVLIRWAFSADERTLYTAAMTDEVHCHDLATGNMTVLRVRLPAGEDHVSVTSLHPAGATLILHARGEFYRVDARTGEILHREHVSSFEDTAPVLQSPDGRTLIGLGRRNQQMHFLSLPGYDQPRSLAWYGPTPHLLATSASWLAIVDRTDVRLFPWPPLLDWYAREVCR